MDVRTTTGEKFVLDRAINRGGEAQIWTVRQEPHLVAKLYHKPTTAHQTKLTAMITAPVSYIAPARELSILFGALLGTWLLKEGDMRSRMLAVTIMVAGIILLSLG